MKKRKLLITTLTIIVMSMLINSSSSFASNEIGSIPLIPISGEDEEGHRGPNYLPILCYHTNGELTFIFSANLATVECEVVRVSDNEVFDATFYATNGGSDSLYVSTAPDDYVITLTCADGSIYYGEYSIE